jgi:hypothetical protein
VIDLARERRKIAQFRDMGLGVVSRVIVMGERDGNDPVVLVMELPGASDILRYR